MRCRLFFRRLAPDPLVERLATHYVAKRQLRQRVNLCPLLAPLFLALDRLAAFDGGCRLAARVWRESRPSCTAVPVSLNMRWGLAVPCVGDCGVQLPLVDLKIAISLADRVDVGARRRENAGRVHDVKHQARLVVSIDVDVVLAIGARGNSLVSVKPQFAFGGDAPETADACCPFLVNAVGHAAKDEARLIQREPAKRLGIRATQQH